MRYGRLRRVACPLIVASALIAQIAPVSAVEGTAWSVDQEGPTAGGEWEGYNKSLDGQRFSPLSQINVSNAATLIETCRVNIADHGSFEAGLVMVKGTLFATTATDTIALDPTTCAVKWRDSYWRKYLPVMAVNRGIAYDNNRVFRGTDDARLIALDATTGREIWTSVVGDPRFGEAVTGVPVAVNGLVIVGTSVSETGIRGRIVAYDEASGREVWRFNTIPAGREMGANTWRKAPWGAYGGGGTWSTMTVDVMTGELFIPVGNPIPDYAPADRPGANLFTDSVLVLDLRSGQLKWWYQLIENDGRDYDLGAAPLLYRDRRNRGIVAAASKDGYVYFIDRATHALLHKVAVTTVDLNPRPPTPAGILACPGAAGGVEWNGPGFDAGLNTLFVGAVDNCSTFRLIARTAWQPGGLNGGGSWMPGLAPSTGWITAIDADSGTVRWKYHADAPILAGITPTAGGVLLSGDHAGNFLIFNSANGDVLKKMPTGGSLSGGVITYEAEGKQYVAMTSGSISRTILGAVGRPTVMIMSLPAAHEAAAQLRTLPDANIGRQVFLTSCALCHGADGKNVTGFDLSTIKSRKSFDELVDFITHPAPPMPPVFPAPINAKDDLSIRDIATYLMQ